MPNHAALLRHVETRLTRSPIVETPFPHQVIDEFLPPAFFDELRLSYPGDPYFALGRETSRARVNLFFGEEASLQLQRDHQAWEQFSQLVTSPEFREKMLRPYRTLLAPHGCLYQPSHRLSTKFDVSRASSGYTRSCHLDRRNHLLATLLYFNERKDYGGQGGEFVLFEPTRSLTDRDKFPPAEDVRVVKEVATRRNRYVSMLNTSHAYHGIHPLRETTGYREFVYLAIDDADLEDAWPPTRVADADRRERFLAE